MPPRHCHSSSKTIEPCLCTVEFKNEIYFYIGVGIIIGVGDSDDKSIVLIVLISLLLLFSLLILLLVLLLSGVVVEAQTGREDAGVEKLGVEEVEKEVEKWDENQIKEEI